MPGRDDRPTGLGVHERSPRRPDDVAGLADEPVVEIHQVVGSHELRYGLQGVEPWIVGAFDGSQLLDRHAVDLTDLGDEQRRRRLLGQVHEQLVDRLTTAAFQDLYGCDVSPDGSDAARHLAESTGTIGKPQAQYVCLHASHATSRV